MFVCSDEGVNLMEGFLQVLPVVVVMDDVADLAIESSDHGLADHNLGHGDLVSEVDVSAEDKKWEHLVNEPRNKVNQSIHVFLLPLPLQYYPICL